MIQTVGDTVLELTLKLTCWQKPAGLDSHIQVLLCLAVPYHNCFHMMHIKHFFLFAHTNGYYVSRTTLLTMQGQFRVNFLTFLFLIVIRCILTQRHAGFEKLILNWYFWNQLNIIDEIVFIPIIWFFLPLYKAINKTKL